MELFVLCSLFFLLFAVVYTVAIIGVVMEVRRMEGTTPQARHAIQSPPVAQAAERPVPTRGATPSQPAIVA